MTDTAHPLFPIAGVVPHDGPMVLLDAIAGWSDEHIETRVTISPQSQFAEPNGVPAWVGMEYMAQTTAALAGCKSRLSEQPVRIGFLVGSRRYECSAPMFPMGSTLIVSAREMVRGSNGLSVFECHIRGLPPHGAVTASANINVFQPEDEEQFMREAAQ